MVMTPVLAGCGLGEDSESSGAIRGLPDNALRIVNTRPQAAETWGYGAFPICLTKAAGRDDIRLTSLVLTGAHDIDLVNAGIRTEKANLSGPAGMPGPLPRDYDPFRGQRFARACGTPEADGVEVAVEVRRTTDGSGWFTGFDILYRQGETERKLHYDVAVGLCVDATEGVCRDDWGRGE